MWRFARSSCCALALGWTLCSAAGCSKSEPEPPPPAQGIPEPGPAVIPAPRAVRAKDRSLPPRRAIAGIAGFQSSSRIVFEREPGKVHTLSATFLFPDRARLCLSLEEDKRLERVILYRAGARGFSIDQSVATSKEIVGEELESLFLQTELRRALFLYPDGFAWSAEGPVRAADLGKQGQFVLQLGPDGLPLSIASFDAAGNRAELLDAIAWKQKGARYFPSHFRLNVGGEPIWNEDVLEVETALDYIDDYFLPPDRRAQDVPAGKAPSDPAIAAIDLPAQWELRVALPHAAASLDEARAAAEALTTTWRDRGVGLQSDTVLELDREGRVAACLLYSRDAGAAPAESWKLRPERPAWSMALASVEALDKAALDKLAGRLWTTDRGAEFELHVAKDVRGGETATLVAARGLR